MDQQNPTAPVPPTPPTQAPVPNNAPPPPPLNPPPPAKHRSFIIYPILIVVLIVGIALGYLLFSTYPGNHQSAPSNANQVTEQATKLTLPSDAVQIQACSDHRGTLYVKPADIPVGPVYMVSKGQVIGVEYMLSQQEFMSGKSFKDLAGNGVKVDHVNIGLLSQGHEGYPIPHYHVDMYSVPKSVEQAILCSGSSTASSSATPSASLNPYASATPSATQK